MKVRNTIAHQHKHGLLSRMMISAFRIRPVRPLILLLIYRFDGGEMHSVTLRRILSKYYGVDVGLYTYGSLLKPGSAPRGTAIGRYSSLGPSISVFRRNHPKEHLSLHPFFYLKRLGFSTSDVLPPVETNPLIIGNDVWIGARVVILPGCSKIGDGAIIGAGSIVTKDVPPFSVVAGNPAKIVGFRFSEATANAVRETAWWDYSISELASNMDVFIRPFGLADLSKLRSS